MSVLPQLKSSHVQHTQMTVDPLSASLHRVLRAGFMTCDLWHCCCRVLQKLYSETLGPYWDERRHLIETHYDGAEDASSLTDVCLCRTAMASMQAGFATCLRHQSSIAVRVSQAWSRASRGSLRMCSAGTWTCPRP